MRNAFFGLGLLIAVGAIVLMVRQFFQLPPVGLETQCRDVAMGFAFLGCGIARFATVEKRPFRG